MPNINTRRKPLAIIGLLGVTDRANILNNTDKHVLNMYVKQLVYVIHKITNITKKHVVAEKISKEEIGKSKESMSVEDRCIQTPTTGREINGTETCGW